MSLRHAEDRMLKHFGKTSTDVNEATVYATLEDTAHGLRYAAGESAETIVGLRKLLEAQDAFIRAVRERNEQLEGEALVLDSLAREEKNDSAD